MKQCYQGGYVGTLIGVLVSLFTIGVVYIYWLDQPVTEFTEVQDAVQPLTASGTAPVTKREAYQADIDAANAVQGRVTSENASIQELLQE